MPRRIHPPQLRGGARAQDPGTGHQQASELKQTCLTLKRESAKPDDAAWALLLQRGTPLRPLNRATPHVEEEDAEVEDAAQALAVVLAETVQVLALPGRVRRQRIARARARDALGRQQRRAALEGRQERRRLRGG